MTTVAFTTVPGLEDLALDELRALAGEVDGELKPDGLAGHVRARSERPDLVDLARGLALAQRVVRPIAEHFLTDDPLAGIRAAMAAVAPSVRELTPDIPFRVRCRRTGDHPFTSEDVERSAGAGVRDVLPCPVRLTGDAVVLRCDVRGPLARIGVEVPPIDRPALPFHARTSLKPQLAAGLLALGVPFGGPAPSVVFDPFCGGGTILVEAARRWPGVSLCGSDLHARNADGVRENLDALGAERTLRCGDARQLGEIWPDVRFDLCVTNPPFGERLGRGLDLEAFYRTFLQAAASCAAPDARLVVLVLKRGAFNRALRGSGWVTRHVRVVELGGLYAGAFVLAPSRETSGGT